MTISIVSIYFAGLPIEGCKGCKGVRLNYSSRPMHTEECRKRMELLIKEQQSERWEKAQERLTRKFAEIVQFFSSLKSP